MDEGGEKWNIGYRELRDFHIVLKCWQLHFVSSFFFRKERNSVFV